jgi:hypothetical protein
VVKPNPKSPKTAGLPVLSFTSTIEYEFLIVSNFNYFSSSSTDSVYILFSSISPSEIYGTVWMKFLLLVLIEETMI